MDIFKKHIAESKNYVGGKSAEEVGGGRKMHKMSSNENALGISPKAVAAAKEASEKLYIYPDGTPKRLTQALAESYDNKIEPSQIIVSDSGSSVIEIITRGLLNEGDEYIVTNPTFQLYKVLGIKAGAKLVDVRLQGDDFQLDVDGILNAITDRTRIIYITNPNNPTGTIFPQDQLDRLFNALPDHLVVVHDEVYEKFVEDPNYSSALKWVLEGKNIIGLNSFSKMYGMAGMRLGYAYTTPKLADYFTKLTKPFSTNRIALEAGIAAVQDKEFLQKSIDHVHRSKKYLYAELDRLGVKYWKTQANFILIKTEKDPSELEQFMVTKGIMVRPVNYFGADGCTRVTFGLDDANEAFIKALEEFRN